MLFTVNILVSRYLQLLDGARRGGELTGVVEILTFMAKQHTPMKLYLARLVAKLQTMLTRHEKRRSGGGKTKEPKTKPPTKRAVAKQAAEAASLAMGLRDASLPVELAVISTDRARELLVGRGVKVRASEYKDDDDGEGESGEGENGGGSGEGECHSEVRWQCRRPQAGT